MPFGANVNRPGPVGITGEATEDVEHNFLRSWKIDLAVRKEHTYPFAAADPVWPIHREDIVIAECEARILSVNLPS